jgi:hypothetical protein
LYSNGPLITHSGAGAGGASVSALQTNLALNTYGFGNQISAGNRLADEFTVPAGGGWYITTATFYSYQTGSTTSSTINAANLRIWRGRPDLATSTVVFGDPTTNRMQSTGWSNIYRTLDTSLTNTERPIMTVVVTVNTALAPGTYWLDWQTGGTLASGPWAPPISILGQTTTGNAVQYANGAWAAVVDPGPNTAQGFPFQIRGNNLTELSGDEAPLAESQAVTATVGLEAGDSLAMGVHSPDLSVHDTFSTEHLPALVVTVINQGATATWRYGSQNGQMTSNPVSNPSLIAYLPLLIRMPGSAAVPAPTFTPTPTPTVGWINIATENFEGTFPKAGWQLYYASEYYWGKRTCRNFAGSYSGWSVGAGSGGGTLTCGAHYPDNVNSWLVYGPFSLADAFDAELVFQSWSNAEAGFDGVGWGASINGTDFYGMSVTGSTSGWVSRGFNLAAVPGIGSFLGQPQVWVSINFFSDGSVTYPEGGYVDEIVLRKRTSAGAPEDVASTNRWPDCTTDETAPPDAPRCMVLRLGDSPQPGPK